ncbi:hypothetical protein BDB00DRAFT_907121 [Zychaea mexicana]|uniref:uncharacterized protein n=1 Tax=Zychaea mexicana TaxID=64656 RepID=UPI0022FDD4D4|nr:uncharacterized protein BDB00DRAFT_907121 [Zychaea mexicana]KAI9493496.1 hypothetical protein BDB00DRAFT_907121 [Zychaea mexicana]
MTLANLDQVLTHYILSTHPLNGSITDLTNKNTGELAYIKIRHKVANMYAISLVDPKTFVAYAETHCKSATSRSRNIVLHCGDEQHKDDKEVTLRETSIFGFEWCFEWAGEQYRWYVFWQCVAGYSSHYLSVFFCLADTPSVSNNTQQDP